MYSIVWRYKIKPEFKDKFEFEYGPNGVWSTLFRESENYRGSYLHQNEGSPYSYLLIDTWTDKSSYEEYKSLNKVRYTDQSSNLDYLYDEEELVGTYTSVT
ncbi:MAG: hypothetical protein ACR2MX_19875 [Cyclobacteriaceae bacterium]